MFALLLPLALLADPTAPTGWGTFRGPDGCGRSEAKNLPEALDPEATLVWRTEVPKGYSSPVLAKDFVFVTGADDEGVATLCLDAATGEELWRQAAPGGPDEHYGGPNSRASSTPATDGERLVCYFPHFGLVCYDLEGKEVWKHELEDLHVPHGASTSPVLCDGLVILQCDQDRGSYLLALDVKSGEQRWRTDRPGTTHGYSTPSIHRPATGAPQLVLSGAFQTSAYLVENGARLWWAEGMCWMPESMPAVGEGLAFVSSYIPVPTEFGGPELPDDLQGLLDLHDADKDGKIGREECQDQGLKMLWFILDIDGDGFFTQVDFELTQRRYSATGGFFAIELGGKGDVTESHVRWKIDDRRKMPGPAAPLIVDGVLYLMKDGGVFASLDPKTGEEFKRGRVAEPEQYWASPVHGDGKIYLAGGSGLLTVVRAGKQWEQLASHALDEPVWATPALADGRVIVRSDAALYSFEVPAGD